MKPGKRKKYKVAISGTVTDAVTGLALAGVLVVAGLKNITTTTDIKGNYKLSVFKKDADFINFSLPDKYIQITLLIPSKYKKSKVVINAELMENIIEN